MNLYILFLGVRVLPYQIHGGSTRTVHQIRRVFFAHQQFSVMTRLFGNNEIIFWEVLILCILLNILLNDYDGNLNFHDQIENAVPTAALVSFIF